MKTICGVEYLDPMEAARILDMRPNTLGQWRRVRGMGPKFLKLGGKVYYRPEDIEEYVRTQTLAPVCKMEAAHGTEE